ncbi:MAG: DUF3052 domain-containing protein [Planctomycetota bacterium]|jgi:hypothetical protein
MPPAGYSGTPLVKKLGIRPGSRVRFVDAPPRYERTLGPLPDDVRILAATRGTLDFIQLFARQQAQLERRLPAAHRALARDGALWICWPKGSSSLDTDLTREIVRELVLATGLVDIKVCAVDENWSGLKFVHRKEDRARKTEPLAIGR